jgi:hypothetical protein
MPTTVRLDAKTEALLNRLAKKTGLTKSQVIRDAIRAFAAPGNRANAEKGPYETIKHLIGCASGGPPDLSERTGEKFRELLLKKRVLS